MYLGKMTRFIAEESVLLSARRRYSEMTFHDEGA